MISLDAAKGEQRSLLLDRPACDANFESDGTERSPLLKRRMHFKTGTQKVVGSISAIFIVLVAYCK